jgi:hypothetical protein
VVESAIVLPVTFLLLLGPIIGGLGIFRYQEMAHLARETARFASVHGGLYAQDNAAAITAGTLPTVNKAYLINQVARANAVSFDPSQLQATVTITIATGAGTYATYDWDDTTNNGNRLPYSTYVDGDNNIVSVTNTVTVTLTYPWMPEAYVAGPINLTSTTVMPMAY